MDHLGSRYKKKNIYIYIYVNKYIDSELSGSTSPDVANQPLKRLIFSETAGKLVVGCTSTDRGVEEK